MTLHRSRTPQRRLARLARLGAVLLASILAGSAAAAGTLDRVEKTGTLRLGYVASARPFSFRDDAGKPTGYTVALCERVAKAVAQKLGKPQLESEWVPTTLEARVGLVADGKVDLICGADTVTLGRRERVDFSIPVFPGGIGALLRKDAPTRMRKILAGEPEPYRPRWRASLGQILEKRTFAVHQGTTTEAWLKEKIAEFDIIATVDPVADYAVGIDEVVSRKADVLFADRAILLDGAKRSPAADDLEVLGRFFTRDQLALMLPRGDEDFRLLVDRTLSELYRSGEIDPIYERYFGAPGEAMRSFFHATALPD